MRLSRALGYFVVVYGDGYIWPETMSARARDARDAMGKIMVGINRSATIKDGWKYALKQGYRVERVDVFPSGRVLDVLQSEAYRPSSHDPSVCINAAIRKLMESSDGE